MSQLAAGKRLIVIGGGLSGLSYVHYLRNFLEFYKKTNRIHKVTLLEANNYMGGSVKTNVFEDGVVHELGPRSIRNVGFKGQNTGVLMEQLGLSDRIVSITALSSAGRDRYIYRNGQLHRVPSSFTKIFTKLPGSDTRMIHAIKRDLFQAKKMDLSNYPYNDPPLYDFIAHRFGVEAAESVLDPLLRGITAGDARQTSCKALFGDMLEKEQLYGSVFKGLMKPPVTKSTHDELFPHDLLESQLLDKFRKNNVLSYNLNTGLQTLPEHLSNSLLNTNDDGLISIYNRTKVTSIKFNHANSGEAPCFVELETVDGDKLTMEADHIVATLPAKDFANILPNTMPSNQRLALDFITKIPHAPVGCVCVEYRNLSNLPEVVNSFGFLTHSKDNSRLLGISFDSAMFPEIDKPVNSTRMTCMIGGAWYKEVLGTDDMDKVTNAQLEQIALEEIRSILKIQEEPFRISTWLWKTGIAQYRPGHSGRIEETRDEIDKLKLELTLLGQSYDGVAINDVVFAARKAANHFVKSL